MMSCINGIFLKNPSVSWLLCMVNMQVLSCIVSRSIFLSQQTFGVGMAICPVLLNLPLLASPHASFPALQRWWDGNGARFQPCTTGWGRDGFRLFRPAPSLPVLTLPRVAQGYSTLFIYLFVCVCVCDYLVKYLDILFKIFFF